MPPKTSSSRLNHFLETLEAEFIGDFTTKDLFYLQEIAALEQAIILRKNHEYKPAIIFRGKYFASKGIKFNKEEAREEFSKLENG